MRCCDEAPAQRAGGFTLMELLVVLAVSGLIVVLLTATLRLAGRAAETVAERSGDGAAFVSVQRVLRQRLGQAYPLVDDTVLPPRKILFTGTARRVDFIGVLEPRPGTPGGLYRMTIAAEPGGPAGQRVVLTQRLFRPDEDPERPAKTRRAVLVADAAGFELRYFGGAREADEQSWQTAWQGRMKLPAIIGIRISFAAGDRRGWAEFLVAPKTEIDARCIFDPRLRRCVGR
jgi:general secretion pathway protein J